MDDLVLWISSDAQGHPGGSHGHFVRMSSFPSMHVVGQMHAGGRWPDFDCAQADLESALLDRGRSRATTVLEDEAGNVGAGTPLDTGLHNLFRAAQLEGLQPTAVINGEPPRGLWVMQPAWGERIPPERAGPYYAASLHRYIRFQAPLGGVTQAGTTQSTRGQQLAHQEDDDMGNFAQAWNAKRPGQDDGDVFLFDENSGHVWHGYEVGAQHAAAEDLGVPDATGKVVGLTGLYTGNPVTFLACRALVRQADGSMHVYEKAGNFRSWRGWGAWVQSA